MAGQFEGLPPKDKAATIINSLRAGDVNSTITFTLTANVATTVLTDPNLTPDKLVFLDPTTANAAAELAAGTIYCLTANRGVGTWTFTHANNAQADRIFRCLIVGG